MCKERSIIIIDNFKNEFNEDVGRHPFLVVDASGGEIEVLPFDFVALVMSSFKSEEHRKKKLHFIENIEIKKEDGALKGSFAKGDQLYLFAKDKIDYYVVGEVTEEIFSHVKERINEIMENDLETVITTNLEL